MMALQTVAGWDKKIFEMAAKTEHMLGLTRVAVSILMMVVTMIFEVRMEK